MAKNPAAVALAKKHIEKHPELHGSDHMSELSRKAAAARTKKAKEKKAAEANK